MHSQLKAYLASAITYHFFTRFLYTQNGASLGFLFFAKIPSGTQCKHKFKLPPT